MWIEFIEDVKWNGRNQAKGRRVEVSYRNGNALISGKKAKLVDPNAGLKKIAAKNVDALKAKQVKADAVAKKAYDERLKKAQAERKADKD